MGRRTTREIEPPKGLRVTETVVAGRSIVVLSWPLDARATADFDARLSGAERGVIALLLSGRTNAEIARLRRTSIGTVKKQVAAAYRKLGVGTRGELAAAVQRQRAGAR